MRSRAHCSRLPGGDCYYKLNYFEWIHQRTHLLLFFLFIIIIIITTTIYVYIVSTPWMGRWIGDAGAQYV